MLERVQRKGNPLTLLVGIQTSTATIKNSKVIPQGLPWWFSGKESACQCRRCGFSPWSDRSPGEEVANHSSILAWEIPGAEEPGGLQSMGL